MHRREFIKKSSLGLLTLALPFSISDIKKINYMENNTN